MRKGKKQKCTNDRGLLVLVVSKTEYNQEQKEKAKGFNNIRKLMENNLMWSRNDWVAFEVHQTGTQEQYKNTDFKTKVNLVNIYFKSNIYKN